MADQQIRHVVPEDKRIYKELIIEGNVKDRITSALKNKKLGEGSYETSYETVDGRLLRVSKGSPFDCPHTIRELLVCRAFDHPNLRKFESVQLVIDGCGRHVLEKEHVQGEPAYLHDYSGSCGTAYRKRMIYHLLRGLKVFHSCDLVHGDVKTNNVFLETSLWPGNKRWACPVLADYGFCCLRGRKMQILCSLEYRSPENFFTDVVNDPATDMWSMGIVACFLLGIYSEVTGSTMPSYFRKLENFHGFVFAAEGECIKGPPDWGISEDIRNKNIVSRLKEVASSPEEADFIIACLDPWPRDRLTVYEALVHPYFDSVRDEIEYDYPVSDVLFQSGTSFGNLPLPHPAFETVENIIENRLFEFSEECRALAIYFAFFSATRAVWPLNYGRPGEVIDAIALGAILLATKFLNETYFSERDEDVFGLATTGARWILRETDAALLGQDAFRLLSHMRKKSNDRVKTANRFSQEEKEEDERLFRTEIDSWLSTLRFGH